MKGSRFYRDFRILVGTMRFNLVWYVPLCIWIVLYIIIPNLTSGLHNVALVFHRFSWGIFFSPSAYVFFSAVITSVFLPLQLLLVVLSFFDPDVPLSRRRHLWSFAVVVVIVLSALLLQAVIWGSFPLPVDKDGYIHVRMIPFIPWPDSPLFH